MNKYLLLFSALFFCTNAIAQTVSGIVVNDNERLSGALIYNLRTSSRAVSDERGLFYIKAQKGDTLVTSVVNYKKDTLIIGSQYNIVIKLKRVAIILKEVIIKDTLTNPLNVYNQNKKDYKDIYWKGDKSKMFSIGAGDYIGVGLNIDKLYSALSKQGNDARRLQRTLTRDYKNNVVDQRFNKTIVGSITGYKGEKLDDFIVKYRPSYEFISKSTNYEIIQYIKKKLALDLKPK